MSWTSHDQLFGWIHAFKLNRNNYFFGGKSGINERPYPIIANNPTFDQVIKNWNRADTGLVLTFFFAGLFVAKRIVANDHLTASHVHKRADFRRIHRVIVAVSLFFALRNSSYRLEGYVPNGLPHNEIDNVVKYDYTSKIVDGTFWRYIFESAVKPTDLWAWSHKIDEI